jgi:hypothetical protein
MFDFKGVEPLSVEEIINKCTQIINDKFILRSTEIEWIKMVLQDMLKEYDNRREWEKQERFRELLKAFWVVNEGH